MSCDTVTNIDLYQMINQFRQNNASIVAQLFKNGLDADTIVPGPKTKHKQGNDCMSSIYYLNRKKTTSKCHSHVNGYALTKSILCI